MTAPPVYTIAVLPGDGIGPEVMAPCLSLLSQAVARVGGFSLSYTELPAGAGCYRDTGVALPETTVDACKRADAILLAAMGLPDVRYPDGTEIVPQIELRMILNLFAGVRPVRSIKGVPATLAHPRAQALDFVLIRESTEGLFASRTRGVVEGDRIARDTMEITRAVSETLFDFAFTLARQRRQLGHPGKVTCVDKANVFRSFAFFRKIFDERAALNPDITKGYSYVDACALDFVRKPWDFDVLVTENMFGDILSDLGAGLLGGLGFAPSADIGSDYAVFQPCHGTAPDIMGRGLANPTAMILSGAMMLEWLALRDGYEAPRLAARFLRDAVDSAFAGGLRSFDIGGQDGTRVVGDAIARALDRPQARVA
jgi:3-isopropylmalate dehydrogenase